MYQAHGPSQKSMPRSNIPHDRYSCPPPTNMGIPYLLHWHLPRPGPAPTRLPRRSKVNLRSHDLHRDRPPPTRQWPSFSQRTGRPSLSTVWPKSNIVYNTTSASSLIIFLRSRQTATFQRTSYRNPRHWTMALRLDSPTTAL